MKNKPMDKITTTDVWSIGTYTISDDGVNISYSTPAGLTEEMMNMMVFDETEGNI